MEATTMNDVKLLGVAVAISLSAAGCADQDPGNVGEPVGEQGMDEVIAQAATERDSWGLSSDHAAVADLLGSKRDVGTARWGIAMTQEEEDALDLEGRMTFANQVKVAAVPFVNALATSGGVYIDQEQNGQLVVLLTEPSPEIEAEISARMPSSTRGFRVAKVKHTEAELRQALDQAWDAWKEIAPSVGLEGAGLDIQNNRVVFEVAPADADGAQAFAAALGEKIGVRVGVEAMDQESVDTSCTGRDHCVSPTKAGTRIYKGYVDGYNECTMAFHVVCGDGDVEFVTAGHCGYGGSNTWLIKDGTADGLVMGTEQKSLYKAGGQDIMRVNLPVGQKSHQIYGESRVYGGSGGCPIAGQVACASRGHSDVVDCGTVRTTWTSWWSNTAGVVVWGGDLNNVDSIPGDSGSPVFDKLDASHWGTVGVLDTAAGGFAVLCKAEVGLGITGLAY
jgi:hypothetical protein